MKKKLLNLVTAVALIFSVATTAEAQYDVPSGDFPYVVDAINFIRDSTDLAEATINVGEGHFLEPAGYGGEAGRNMKITVQGAGADKTFIKGFEDGELELGKDIGRRFMSLHNATDDGTEFVFKELTIKNWGWGTGGTGGFLNSGRPIGTVKVSFINVNFENLMAGRGAVVQIYDEAKTTIFDNCSFFNCTAHESNSMFGLIYARGTNVTIKNCLFMSNTIDVRDYSGDMTDQDRKRGGILHLQATSKGNTNAVVENNIFVNNLTESDMNDVLHPVIGLHGGEDGLLKLNVTMKNNIAIENAKEGREMDVDLYYRDNAGLELTAESNIINSAIRRVMDGEVANYLPIEVDEVDGIEIQPNHTYEDFNYVMDGDLPSVTTDEFGVKIIEIESVSVLERSSDNRISVYNDNNGLIVKGLKSGEILEIYTITGHLYATHKVNQSSVRLNVPQGIYILKAGMSACKAVMPY